MARTPRPERRQLAGPQRPLILDSGAVVALSRGADRARAVLAAALEAGVEVVVPAVVLAETLRGRADDAPVHRVLNAVGEFPPADDGTCRVAAHLLEAAASDATVDAIVVAVAVSLGGGVILTADASDLSALAADHPEVALAPC